MRLKKLGASFLFFTYALTVSSFFVTPPAEARFGGGRSFGSRGSRGFSAPSYSGGSRSYGGSPYSTRPATPAYGNTAPGYANPAQRPYQAPSTGSTFLKSMGAGIAGGFIGNMLFRSMGMGGGYGMGAGGFGGGGGFGIFEFLVLLGLIFLLFKVFARKTLPANSGYPNDYSQNNSSGFMNDTPGRDEAANLMREARPNGWLGNNASSNDSAPFSPSQSGLSESAAIDRDQAMDLFFQVQGAWANRDLSSASNLLDSDARKFLEEEIYRLKSLKQINRLENIAVRDVQTVESWREMGKDYSTVKITANLLDFTVDESSLQVVSGSKTTPVKFEEYWTFAREDASPWKLSAIQQS